MWKIEKNGSNFKIRETASDNIVCVASWKDCANLIRELKRGIGFNGFTPNFMLQHVDGQFGTTIDHSEEVSSPSN